MKIVKRKQRQELEMLLILRANLLHLFAQLQLENALSQIKIIPDVASNSVSIELLMSAIILAAASIAAA